MIGEIFSGAMNLASTYATNAANNEVAKQLV